MLFGQSTNFAPDSVKLLQNEVSAASRARIKTFQLDCFISREMEFGTALEINGQISNFASMLRATSALYLRDRQPLDSEPSELTNKPV
ncbi:MAG: hypothetical protein E5X65_26335 [Mesorhizobium sp.]|nr:MAG: hypothetical protein E5X65_26335 [Mesorhizobium sp.]